MLNIAFLAPFVKKIFYCILCNQKFFSMCNSSILLYLHDGWIKIGNDEVDMIWQPTKRENEGHSSEHFHNLPREMSSKGPIKPYNCLLFCFLAFPGGDIFFTWRLVAPQHLVKYCQIRRKYKQQGFIIDLYYYDSSFVSQKGSKYTLAIWT